MYRANKVIPVMASGHFLYPQFVAWNEIDFKAEPDGQGRVGVAGVLHLCNVFIQFAGQHAPVILVIVFHG